MKSFFISLLTCTAFYVFTNTSMVTQLIFGHLVLASLGLYVIQRLQFYVHRFDCAIDSDFGSFVRALMVFFPFISLPIVLFEQRNHIRKIWNIPYIRSPFFYKD